MSLRVGYAGPIEYGTRLSTLARALVYNMQQRIPCRLEALFNVDAIPVYTIMGVRDPTDYAGPSEMRPSPFVIDECERLGLIQGHIREDGSLYWVLTEAGRALKIPTISSGY